MMLGDDGMSRGEALLLTIAALTCTLGLTLIIGGILYALWHWNPWAALTTLTITSWLTWTLYTEIHQQPPPNQPR